jgi:hypothetical protein
MNAEGELLRIYREWLRLAQAETKAIQTRNWNLLSDCHIAIQDFQALVGDLTREARAEWRRDGFNLDEKEKNLRVLVSELVDLTRHNQKLLQSGLASARKQLGALGESGNNLKLLKRSYGAVSLHVLAL